MSVTIGNCRKEISFGYHEFYCLRCEIAELLDTTFGLMYSDYVFSEIDGSPMDVCKRKEELLDEYIEKHKLDDDVLDFLFQPDCGGKLSPKACKSLSMILRKWKDSEYSRIQGARMIIRFSDFKMIVWESWKNRRQLRWY